MRDRNPSLTTDQISVLSEHGVKACRRRDDSGAGSPRPCRAPAPARCDSVHGVAPRDKEIERAIHGDDSQQSSPLHGIQKGQRARRHTQSRACPAGGRSLQRRLRSGGPEHHQRHRHSPQLWTRPVRTGSGDDLPPSHRNGSQPQRGGGGLHRHRTGLDGTGRRGDRRDREAGRRIQHRGARRPGRGRRRLQSRRRIRQVGERAGPRAVPDERLVGGAEVRGIGHDHRSRLQPGAGQRG